MRTAGLILFAALAVTLILSMDAVCGADEDGCLGFCACVCCGHNGLYIDSSTAADAANDTAPVQAEVSPILLSLRVSPDFPPPEIMTFSPV
jgi:hypothetical protein